MADMSNYLTGEVRKHIFRTGSFTKPSALYLCLCTSAPTASSTGSTIVEPTTGGYTRQALNPSDSNWAGVTTGQTSNLSAVTWTASGGNYGTITHVAICDASTAGNMLLFDALAASKTINDGDSFQFAIGGVTATLS